MRYGISPTPPMTWSSIRSSGGGRSRTSSRAPSATQRGSAKWFTCTTDGSGRPQSPAVAAEGPPPGRKLFDGGKCHAARENIRLVEYGRNLLPTEGDLPRD